MSDKTQQQEGKVEMKHTPGPWTWDGNVWGYDREQEAPWLVAGEDHAIRILSGEINASSEANARLIAAAPELLAALAALLPFAKVCNDAGPVGELYYQTDAFEDAIADAKAAIAKATGAA